MFQFVVLLRAFCASVGNDRQAIWAVTSFSPASEKRFRVAAAPAFVRRRLNRPGGWETAAPYGKIVTATRSCRSLLMVWMRSRLHG
jgi:hypothetical protein